MLQKLSSENKRKIKRLMKLLTALTLAILISGCNTHVRLNNAERLINRADFDVARTTAPEWCRDALKTINELELEIERR